MPVRSIDVHRLPDLVSTHSFCDCAAVVVDILRATSTITTALVHSAKNVVPCETIEQAHFLRIQIDSRASESEKQTSQPDCRTRLCGERNWERIPGFDHGNSPKEYIDGDTQNRTLIFTTTNGTHALHHAYLADSIYLGSFLNLSALVKKLSGESQIRILCSGTKGEPSWEDELFAGALVERLSGDHCQLNDVAMEVMQSWQEFTDDDNVSLFESLCSGTGGSNLVKRGLDRDIRYCAQIDIFDTVAQYFPNENEIRLS